MKKLSNLNALGSRSADHVITLNEFRRIKSSKSFHLFLLEFVVCFGFWRQTLTAVEKVEMTRTRWFRMHSKSQGGDNAWAETTTIAFFYRSFCKHMRLISLNAPDLATNLGWSIHYFIRFMLFIDFGLFIDNNFFLGFEMLLLWSLRHVYGFDFRFAAFSALYLFKWAVLPSWMRLLCIWQNQRTAKRCRSSRISLSTTAYVRNQLKVCSATEVLREPSLFFNRGFVGWQGHALRWPCAWNLSTA